MQSKSHVDGNVVCWGRNEHAQLGDDTLTSRSTPASVVGLSDVTALAAALDHTCASLGDGTVSCWGHDNSDVLSEPALSDSLVPQPIAGIGDAVSIDTSYTHACATDAAVERSAGARIPRAVWEWALPVRRPPRGSTLAVTSRSTELPVQAVNRASSSVSPRASDRMFALWLRRSGRGRSHRGCDCASGCPFTACRVLRCPMTSNWCGCSALAMLMAVCLTGCVQRETDSSSCDVGAERCACYPNGTCDDGLECLSNHCVDITATDDESADAAARGPSQSDASSSSADDEPSDGTNDDGPGVTPKPNPDTDDSTEPAADDPATDDTTDETDELKPVASGPTDVSPEGGASGPSLPTDDTATDDTATDDTATDDTVTDDTVTDDTVTDDTVTDDTGTDPPGLDQLAPLPPRATGALDAVSTEKPAATSCATSLNEMDVCRTAIQCADPDACLATFEWIYARSTTASGSTMLELHSLSADGTVIAGDDISETDQSSREVFVWRWGDAEITHPAMSVSSSATALNFDATALVGAMKTCSTCDYDYVLWMSSVVALFPAELNSPRDISYDRTVVGSIRDEESVLWGYMWDGTTPVSARTLALHKVSGDGQFAAGVADGGGPVVLFYANGTKSMPSVGTFRPYEVMDVTEHGEVVVGYGFSDAAGYSLFRWRVDEGVDLIDPLSGYAAIAPFSVDKTGEIMVGVNRVESTSKEGDQVQTFYWDESDGMRPLVDELAERGVELPDNMYLHMPRMSADGTTVVGGGFLGSAAILWRARLVQP